MQKIHSKDIKLNLYTYVHMYICMELKLYIDYRSIKQQNFL